MTYLPEVNRNDFKRPAPDTRQEADRKDDEEGYVACSEFEDLLFIAAVFVFMAILIVVVKGLM